MVDPNSFKDQRNLTTGDSDNPLTKRENFSISLRKQKKQEILNQKRRKLIMKVEEQLQRQQAFQPTAATLNSTNSATQNNDSFNAYCMKEYPGYNGPPEQIKDKPAYQQLIKRLAPQLTNQVNVCAKVDYVLELLKVNSEDASAKDQLALLVALRQSLSDQHITMDLYLSVVTQTDILNVIMVIINAEPQSQTLDDELYWMKLEALWIALTISYSDDDCTERLLISSPGQFDDVSYRHDFGLLECLNKMLKQCVEGQFQDMKTLSMVLQLLLNIVVSNDDDFACQVICNTCIPDTFTMVHQVIQQVPREIQDYILTIIENCVAKCEISKDIITQFVKIAVKELLSYQDDELEIQAVRILGKIIKADSSIAKLNCISDANVIKALINVMNKDNMKVKAEGFQALSMMATCDSQFITQMLLEQDFMHHIQLMCSSTDLHIVRHAMFTISNLLVEDQGISAFIQNDSFLCSVLFFIENKDISISCEAAWAISNMVTSASAPLLKSILIDNNENHLEIIIGQLVIGLGNLKRSSDHNLGLQKNILQSLQRMFDLESEELMSTSSQSSNQPHSPYLAKALMFAEQRGLCQILDNFILSKNEEIATLTNQISNKYFNVDKNNFYTSNNHGANNIEMEMADDNGQSRAIFNI